MYCYNNFKTFSEYLQVLLLIYTLLRCSYIYYIWAMPITYAKLSTPRKRKNRYDFDKCLWIAILNLAKNSFLQFPRGGKLSIFIFYFQGCLIYGNVYNFRLQSYTFSFNLPPFYKILSDLRICMSLHQKYTFNNFILQYTSELQKNGGLF